MEIATPKLFDKIVRDEINHRFYLRFMTDQRVPKLYKRFPEKELKEKAYSIFFKSFDNILESIGIPRGKKPRIYTYHYKGNWTIKWVDIVEENFPGKKFEENKDIEFDYNQNFVYFFHKRKKYVIGLYGRIETIERYLIQKGIFEPYLEAFRGLRYKTLEERTHDGYIEWDEYNLARVVGTNIADEIRGYEENIWHPHVWSFSEENTFHIGL